MKHAWISQDGVKDTPEDLVYVLVTAIDYFEMR